VRVSEIVEPQPASSPQRDLFDRLPLARVLRRPIATGPVPPDRPVPVRAVLDDGAQETGPDQGRQPHPLAEVRPALWRAELTREHQLSRIILDPEPGRVDPERLDQEPRHRYRPDARPRLRVGPDGHRAGS